MTASAATRVGVVGTGYVGLTTAACLARLGHRVRAVDADRAKISRLQRQEITIDEPGLADLVTEGMRSGRLDFSDNPKTVADADFVMLCVPTPAGPDGRADLSSLEAAGREVAGMMPSESVIIIKSTVPPGTTEKLEAELGRPVINNPEFLRESAAVRDFLFPDRVVIGASDPAAAARAARLFAGIDSPVLITRPASAELIKYASNAFLAVKISYANELNELAINFGADISEVTHGVGLDPRIGPAALAPGPGWGGSCLPKDTMALSAAAHDVGVPLNLVDAAVAVNRRQIDQVTGQVRSAVSGHADGVLDGCRIALLGLTFKAATSDLRDSPALAVAHRLHTAGATLSAYDPAIRPGSVQALGVPDFIQTAESAEDAVRGADGLVVLTEWPQFRELDWSALSRIVRRPLVIDARNLLDPAKLQEAGLTLLPLGLRAAEATMSRV